MFSESVHNIIKGRTTSTKHFNNIFFNTEKLSMGHSTYKESSSLISQAADYMDIRDKNVLVIGTEVPWMETLLLQRRPR